MMFQPQRNNIYNIDHYRISYKDMSALIYATLILKHSDWLRNFFNQSERSELA